jgi:rhamnosyltransferase
MLKDVVIIVPTLNAGELWRKWINAYNQLDNKPECLVIDSSSSDDTVRLAREAGFKVEVIGKNDFDHGGTRNLGLSLTSSRYVIFMTQDAILADRNSVNSLLKPFQDDSIAAVCGRQLARENAGVFEKYSRYKNYPDHSTVKSYADKGRYGIRTAFMSNSFSAYRRDVLETFNGFPNKQIFGEDMSVTARMLNAGWKIAYASEAKVIHSHNYTLRQEMKRYFDMGVFHAREPWIREEFGGAEKAGLGFFGSEISYLCIHAFWRIPEGLLRTVFRYTGFRLGLIENRLPLWLKRVLVMNSGYFS